MFDFEVSLCADYCEFYWSKAQEMQRDFTIFYHFFAPDWMFLQVSYSSKVNTTFGTL